jgi:hypothetical protein
MAAVSNSDPKRQLAVRILQAPVVFQDIRPFRDGALRSVGAARAEVEVFVNAYVKYCLDKILPTLADLTEFETTILNSPAYTSFMQKQFSICGKIFDSTKSEQTSATDNILDYCDIDRTRTDIGFLALSGTIQSFLKGAHHPWVMKFLKGAEGEEMIIRAAPTYVFKKGSVKVSEELIFETLSQLASSLTESELLLTQSIPAATHRKFDDIFQNATSINKNMAATMQIKSLIRLLNYLLDAESIELDPDFKKDFLDLVADENRAQASDQWVRCMALLVPIAYAYNLLKDGAGMSDDVKETLNVLKEELQEATNAAVQRIKDNPAANLAILKKGNVSIRHHLDKLLNPPQA